MEKRQHGHNQICVKRNGFEQRLYNRKHAEPGVLLLCRHRRAVGPAQTDKRVSGIKQAGCHHTNRTQEALGKGHGKITYIVSWQIQYIECPFFPIFSDTHKKGHGDIQNAACKAQQCHHQHGRLQVDP